MRSLTASRQEGLELELPRGWWDLVEAAEVVGPGGKKDRPSLCLLSAQLSTSFHRPVLQRHLGVPEMSAVPEMPSPKPHCQRGQPSALGLWN